jgi:predicted O-methyltransferase YrrM
VKETALALDPLTQGWFNHGDHILALVEQHKPKVCVELGSWQGASAIPVARAIRRWHGTLTCVDTWGGEIHESRETPWMLLSCVRNMRLADVCGNVRLIPTTSQEAAQWWTEPIDYLYVDADHSYEAVRDDLAAWVPHVKPGGLILGDDYWHRGFPGVKRAWDEFARDHDLVLTAYNSNPPNPDGIQLIYGVLPS